MTFNFQGQIPDAVYTSSGNQTPGCVLPSRTARANAAVEFPTDLKEFQYNSRCEEYTGLILLRENWKLNEKTLKNK